MLQKLIPEIQEKINHSKGLSTPVGHYTSQSQMFQEKAESEYYREEAERYERDLGEIIKKIKLADEVINYIELNY